MPFSKAEILRPSSTLPTFCLSKASIWCSWIENVFNSWIFPNRFLFCHDRAIISFGSLSTLFSYSVIIKSQSPQGPLPFLLQASVQMSPYQWGLAGDGQPITTSKAFHKTFLSIILFFFTILNKTQHILQLFTNLNWFVSPRIQGPRGQGWRFPSLVYT